MSDSKYKMARCQNCKASSYTSKQHGYVSKPDGNAGLKNQMQVRFIS